MDKADETFKAQLQATFEIEAREHLDVMAEGITRLDRTAPGDEQARLLETIFREAHSLKGAARAVGQSMVEGLCQSLESRLSALKRQKGQLAPDQFEPIQELLRPLEALILPAPGTAAAEPQPPDSPAPAPPLRASQDTVRVGAQQLASILLQLEEMLSLEHAAEERVTDLRTITRDLQDWRREMALFWPSGSSVAEPAQAQWHERNQAFLDSLQERLYSVLRRAEQGRHGLSSRLAPLVADARAALQLPFSTLLQPLHRLARDLAHDHDKLVEVITQGGDVKVDRRILQQLKDPLTHLLRNAVDYGIELPLQRRQAGKSPTGAISVCVSALDARSVELTFSDDGAGVDLEKLRRAAVRGGLFTAAEAGQLGPAELTPLIFQSGLSTRDEVGDLSGRGLGLAIVQEKVELLGASISIESTPGQGTRFRLVLPATLATCRALLVRVRGRVAAIPVSAVHRVGRVPLQQVRTVKGRPVLLQGEEALPLVDLGAVLELEGTSAGGSDHACFVVIEEQQSRVAFRVDEVLREQEIRVKSLGPQLARVRNVSGATILGSGRLVPILHPQDLLESAPRSRLPASRALPPPRRPARRKVLVVEDSITARTLLKNILEGAGYLVRTAVDGLDAIGLLGLESFDLVVSDVDMPRLDGFDLTERIRADHALHDLPVVLLTSLESPEERLRGADAGASAYIVKSSFDQSNLLEVMDRFA